MEVTLEPLKGLDGRLSLQPAIQVESSVKRGKPYITIGAVFNLKLINHRTDRSERIVGCSLDLKKRYWLLWNKTIISIPVPGFSNLELSPLSAPVYIEVKVYRTFHVQQIPHRAKLVLKFKMVGPMRKYERVLKKSVSSNQPRIVNDI